MIDNRLIFWVEPLSNPMGIYVLVYKIDDDGKDDAHVYHVPILL